MDYEVFILSRMREEYDATGSTDTAVIRGIGRTGRLVTRAALIMFLAFVAMRAAPGTGSRPPPRRKQQQPGVLEGWSDLIKLSSAGAAHPGPTRATGSGRPGAAGRYVRPRSPYARLPR